MEPMFRLRERYAQKAAPAWSWLVATLNDPNLIAVSINCCSAECLLVAHRVISLPRSNWVAFGVKRTSTRAGHRTGFMSTRP
jgi:hypothetical protein